MSVLFISGSPSRRPSRSSALLDHVASRLILAGVPVHRLSLWDFPAADLIEVRQQGDASIALRRAVDASDAIVVSTPVYNASVPGGLKAVLDLLAERSLTGKSVLPLASGGSAGHQLAIEYSLKPVLSALGARHVLAGVFACDGDVAWQGDTSAFPVFGPDLTQRLDAATDTLLALLQRPVDADRAFPAAWSASRVAATVSIPERCSA